MNKFKSILWGVMFVIPTFAVISGCSKFLDRQPLSATLDDLNQGGLEGQIYGLYGAMRNDYVSGQGFGGIPWLALHGFRADDSEKGSSPSDGASWAVMFDQFQYQKDDWAPTIYWDQHYTLIGLANVALQIADSLNLTDPASMVNRAEARFLRAFTYFDLVRTFGEVPKFESRIYTLNDSKKPKATVPQIYAFIDADLQFAMQYLPNNWNNASGVSKFPGRLTNSAAKGFAAKTMLYRQNWGGALGLCNQIISSGNHSLYSDYFKLFTEAGENSKESLFEIQAYIGPNGQPDFWYYYGIAQGVRGSGEWDLGWGWNTPTQTLVDSYEPNDSRKNATILFSGQSDGVYGRVLPPFPSIPRLYWNKKVYPEPAMQASTGKRQAGWVNQRVLRYADVLLMAAEAANETGAGATTALGWVNQIRNRAGLPNIAFVSQAQMRAAIKKERRSEFGMEGERFFDLVRWNDAITVLGPLGYQNKHRYHPIPQAAIDFSAPLLIQNPEW